ncbi:L-tyrosine decarboxylase, partial [Acropora cervicornis]
MEPLGRERVNGETEKFRCGRADWISGTYYYWPLNELVDNDTKALGTIPGTVYGNVNKTYGFPLGRDTLHFSSSGAYLDVGPFPAECIIDPSKCIYGITVSFVVQFEDNAQNWTRDTLVVDTIGGKTMRKGNPGFAVYVANNRLYVTVVTRKNNWTVSESLITGDMVWQHVLFSWHMEKGLVLYLNGTQSSSECFLEKNPCAALGAWFLGPNGENADIFQDLLTKAVNSHISFRRSYFPGDPPYITSELRQSGSFKNALKNLKTELESLQNDLGNSVPFFSSRYKGHVNWDTNMPANLGYISAMLFNQNNCCAESSTVTTKFEVEVGNDLCVMMGYEKDRCMGHLTSGGTTANIEAIWAARNVKYFPLGLQEALLKEDRLSKARGYKVPIPQRGSKKEVVSASQWELLNLDVESILKMPLEVEVMAKLQHQEFMEIMENYLYESIGALEFTRRHKLTKTPCVMVPRTSHVSFSKAVTMLGLGRDSLVTVKMDEDARMDTNDLKTILTEKMQQEIPVITVVPVMGTTEEGAVDPLTEILALKDEFKNMMRDPPHSSDSPDTEQEGFVPEMYLSTYVQKQLSALQYCDTVTTDPHKSGFCPYPAGAICYRDKVMNSFLQAGAGVAYYHGKRTLGDVGIEGSKPGAAAAGVMLANRVIGLHKNGYGRILAECMFTSKIVYCLWVTLAKEDDNFVIQTTKPLPKFKNWSEPEQLRFIRERILGKSNERLVQVSDLILLNFSIYNEDNEDNNFGVGGERDDEMETAESGLQEAALRSASLTPSIYGLTHPDEEVMEYLKEVGPDTLMPCFSVNIKGNKSVELCNAVNTALFQSLRHTSDEHTAQLIVTASCKIPYKQSVAVSDFMKRLGWKLDPYQLVQYPKFRVSNHPH